MEDKNRKDILKHIDKLEEFARKPENLWLLANLQQRFSACGKKEELNEIYEYCLEKNLRQQANDFYKMFPTKDIVPRLVDNFVNMGQYDSEGIMLWSTQQRLVDNFVKMEHYRRKDYFDEFVMAVYQQLEIITDVFCFNRQFGQVAARLMGHPAYVSSTQTYSGEWKSPTIQSRVGSYPIAHLLFGKDNAYEKAQEPLHQLSPLDRINVVLYFICYGAKLQPSQFYMFMEQKSLIGDIYHFHCRFYSSSFFASQWQEEIYKRVTAQKGFYYMKCMQLLCFFVENASDGALSFDSLSTYAMQQKPIELKPFKKNNDNLLF